MIDKTSLKASILESLFQASKPVRNSYIDGLNREHFYAAKLGWIAGFYDKGCPYDATKSPKQALLSKTFNDAKNEAIGCKNALVEMSITMLEGWQK